MKKTWIAPLLGALLSLPVHAADGPQDALGQGLDALWRASGGAGATVERAADILDRRSLFEGAEMLSGDAAALRSGGVGFTGLHAISRESVALSAGTGFRARVSNTRGTGGTLDAIAPIWLSSSAAYEGDSWRAFASLERGQGWLLPGSVDQGLRLGAAYRRAGTELSAGWETMSHEAAFGDAAQKAWWIGFAQRVGDGALKLNFARALDASSGSGSLNGVRQFALGYEHGLSPQTAVFAFYTRLSNDPNGLFQLGGGEVDNGPLGLGRGGISLGIRHNF